MSAALATGNNFSFVPSLLSAGKQVADRERDAPIGFVTAHGLALGDVASHVASFVTGHVAGYVAGYVLFGSVLDRWQLDDGVSRDAVPPRVPALVAHHKERPRLEQHLGDVLQIRALVSLLRGLLELHVDRREERDRGDDGAEGGLVFKMARDAKVLNVLVDQDLAWEVAAIDAEDVAACAPRASAWREWV
eukprot:2659814-Pleurochrysis_carterae.AAC.3